MDALTCTYVCIDRAVLMADGQDVSKMSDQQIQDVIKSRAKEDTVIIKDLNPFVEKLIICDNVLDKKGDGSVDGLDASSLTTLMNNMFSHLVANVAVIGCGTMHNVGGYMGLKKAADLLNMTVPLLLLDIRQRDEQFMRVASTADKREQLQRLIAADNDMCDALVNENRSPDTYEMCRMAHLHSHCLQTPPGHSAAGAISKDAPLWQAIIETHAQMQSAQSDGNREIHKQLLEVVSEHCLQKEFEAYWRMLPAQELKKLEEKGVVNHKQMYAEMMMDGRAAYHSVLSHDLLYTAHVNHLSDLAFIVNHVMMKKERLPQADSLEGLRVSFCPCVWAVCLLLSNDLPASLSFPQMSLLPVFPHAHPPTSATDFCGSWRASRCSELPGTLSTSGTTSFASSRFSPKSATSSFSYWASAL